MTSNLFFHQILFNFFDCNLDVEYNYFEIFLLIACLHKLLAQDLNKYQKHVRIGFHLKMVRF